VFLDCFFTTTLIWKHIFQTTSIAQNYSSVAQLEIIKRGWQQLQIYASFEWVDGTVRPGDHKIFCYVIAK